MKDVVFVLVLPNYTPIVINDDYTISYYTIILKWYIHHAEEL